VTVVVFLSEFESQPAAAIEPLDRPTPRPSEVAEQGAARLRPTTRIGTSPAWGKDVRTQSTLAGEAAGAGFMHRQLDRTLEDLSTGAVGAPTCHSVAVEGGLLRCVHTGAGFLYLSEDGGAIRIR
jgi:hypothetical protein